jgi:hypothetical protein
LTDILPHSPSPLKRLNLYSHTSAAPTAPTTAYLQQQTSPTSLKPCQTITQIPTDLTHHLSPSRLWHT